MRRARLSPRWVVLGSLSIILLIGLGAVLFLTQLNQDTRQQASVSQGPVQVRFNPSLTQTTPGQQLSFNLQVNTAGRQVDGVQLVYGMTGNYPTAQNLTFTPAPGVNLELANNLLTSSEGGVKMQIGLVTKNPAQPFSSTTYVTVGTLRFTAPASGSFTLTPEPTGQLSKAIEHTTLVDLLRYTTTAKLQVNVQAASPSPRPAHAVDWQTPYARLSVNDFAINVGGQKYQAIPDPGTAVQVHSNPGSGSNPTIEATWTEYGNEMRLFVYFAKQGTSWVVSEIRSYNGQNPGGWLFYPPVSNAGVPIGSHPLGSAATFPTLNIASDNQSAIVGNLTWSGVTMQPFFAATPIPSPSIIASPIPTPTPTPSPIVCSTDVMQCPNGSYVSRSPARNCDFLPCPSPSPAVTPSPSAQASPTACAATADINQDNKINISDYAALLRAYVSGQTDTGADLNCDGKINLIDYSILLQAYRGG